jgi:hypothetical protein
MEQFFYWYNLIYYIPIVFAIITVVGVFFGIGGFDADIDADVDADADADTELHHGLNVLSMFGIGRCPISIVIISWCCIFSGSGLILNHFLVPVISIIISSVLSLLFTRFLSTVLSKIIPSTETYAATKEDLIGCVGSVVVKVTTDFGQINVIDKFGNLHRANARSYNNSFAVNELVLVVEYKEKGDVYYVDEMPQEAR